MLELLMSILQGDALPPVAAWGREDVEGAAAALLVEAGRVDRVVARAERATMAGLLGERFGLAPAGAGALMALGAQAAHRSVQLHRFATRLTQPFSEAGRLGLVEMPWPVVYAAVELCPYAANFL